MGQVGVLANLPRTVLANLPQPATFKVKRRVSNNGGRNHSNDIPSYCANHGESEYVDDYFVPLLLKTRKNLN